MLAADPDVEANMAPSPEQIADALKVAEMGGDLPRLAEVCRHQAELYQGDGRQRLLDAAEALAWGAKVLAAMETSQQTEEESGAAR
jgi:hypothetical protein